MLDVSSRKRNGLLLANTIADTQYTTRSNPIYVQANATSRHAVSIRQSA